MILVPALLRGKAFATQRRGCILALRTTCPTNVMFMQKNGFLLSPNQISLHRSIPFQQNAAHCEEQSAESKNMLDYKVRFIGICYTISDFPKILITRFLFKDFYHTLTSCFVFPQTCFGATWVGPWNQSLYCQSYPERAETLRIFFGEQTLLSVLQASKVANL